MTAAPAGVAGHDMGADPGAPRGEAAARRRHPSARRWRADHDGLRVRLARHLEAEGWTVTAAGREAAEAQVAARLP